MNHFFFGSDVFCPEQGVVLDPFCGAGTVLLEANLSGRCALGADSNPLARLISMVKTTYIEKESLQNTLISILNRTKRSKVDYLDNMQPIIRWFSKSTIRQLLCLEESIAKVSDENENRFFSLCFSNLVRKVSFADPSISVPVKLNPSKFSNNPSKEQAIKFKIETLNYIDVFERFKDICQININRVESLRSILSVNTTSKIISTDARFLTESLNSSNILPSNSVDTILTSPPYAGAQKYIRASWLNLFWLGIRDMESIRALNRNNIGREDYRKSEFEHHIITGISDADCVLDSLYGDGKNERAYIAGNYLNEMKCALDECYRVLKPGGTLIIVIGNNSVCGRYFDTESYITTYLSNKGMYIQLKLIDNIKSYGLMTKRNKTASRISCEWVLVLKK